MFSLRLRCSPMPGQRTSRPGSAGSLDATSAAMSFIEKWANKWCPKAIRVFFVPMLCFGIGFPVALVVLGPLGYNIGALLTTVILALYNTLGWLAVALLAAVLPFMISMGMHKALVPYAVASISDPGFEMLYMAIAAAIHVVLLVLSALLSRPLKLDAVEQVNVIYSNAAALVIPLVKALMGDAYVIYSCAFIIVQLVLLWTHASSLLQGSSALDWKKVLTNINMIAIAAGALLYWFRVVLPAPLQNTMSTVGNMMGPMGMLLAGMAIAEKPLREVFCTRRNYLPTVLRLVVCPLVVLVLLWVCHASSWVADGKNILMTVYLAAITPACATVTSMAQLYDRDAAHSSALYVLTTLLSIVSMPIMIGLFDLLL